MFLAPVSHAADCFVATEVFSTELGAPPMTLTGHLAGLMTGWSRTVMLVMPVTRIGREERPATTAFAPAWFATHRGPRRKKTSGRSNQKNGTEENPRRRRKKSFQSEQPKKTQSEEDGVSDRRFSGTFIPPLTPAAW